MVATEITESYADGSLRKLGQEELSNLLDADDDDDLNDDLHTDDEPIQAVTLESRSEFAAATRFDTTGSIADASDVDFYRVRAPQAALGASVLTVAIRTLELGGLVPQVTVFDHDQNEIASSVLANGGGQLIVQIAGIESDRDYLVRVSAADITGPFSSGNYQLTASFGDQVTTPTQYAAATLAEGTGHNRHTLYVAEPQLFHFLLQADSTAVAAQYALIASIYDSSGQLVHRLATAPGETRSSNAVLLDIGTYNVIVHAASLSGAVAESVNYELLGVAISDPFVSDPSDPTTHPFYNPDPTTGGVYLYPGDIPSDDPFLWDDFIATMQEPPPELPLPELVSVLLGDWWSWFWTEAGVAGPPLAVDDTFATPRDVPISATAAAGVLSNDIEPSSLAMSAVLVTGPSLGQLTLNANGSFQFDPAPGYSGIVSFTYQSTNFSQMSLPATVTIVVGVQGDFDGNGVVDEFDHGVWMTQFGATGSSPADGNADSAVDAADYVMWRKMRDSLALPPPELPGDYNRDLSVDAADYVAWRKTMGSAVPRYSAADGDGDGLVDPDDYGTWQASFGQTSAPALAGSGVAVSSISMLSASSTFDSAGASVPAIDSFTGRKLAAQTTLRDFNTPAADKLPTPVAARKSVNVIAHCQTVQGTRPVPIWVRAVDEAFAESVPSTNSAWAQAELAMQRFKNSACEVRDGSWQSNSRATIDSLFESIGVGMLDSAPHKHRALT
jgi:hypothetical protein